MSETPSFDELKARLAKGDPEAVTIIYAKFSARLLAVARAQLGLEFQAKLDPEDLAQSAFRSFFRREAGGQTLPHGPDGNWEAIGPEPSPEQVAIAADLREYLLRKCGQRCRAILALSFENYTVREISEKLDCDQGTVRRILQRARDVAKRFLPEATKGDGEGT
jgi:DNA-directed RNA polymerase specialized sigma24 family protein